MAAIELKKAPEIGQGLLARREEFDQVAQIALRKLLGDVLGLLGEDHKRLTYFSQGRDYRLSDVGGDNNLAARLVKA